MRLQHLAHVLMAQQIVCGREDHGGVIAKITNSAIASVTQKSSWLPSAMAMIDMESLKTRRPRIIGTADSTAPLLGFSGCFVPRHIDAALLQDSAESIESITFGSLQPCFPQARFHFWPFAPSLFAFSRHRFLFWFRAIASRCFKLARWIYSVALAQIRATTFTEFPEVITVVVGVLVTVIRSHRSVIVSCL